jgi:hypothetical protein
MDMSKIVIVVWIYLYIQKIKCKPDLSVTPFLRNLTFHVPAILFLESMLLVLICVFQQSIMFSFLINVIIGL